MKTNVRIYIFKNKKWKGGIEMDENQQITYMQARLIRLASEEWNLSIKTVAAIFEENNVFRFIRECFDIFHVEGDYAVLDNIVEYLNNKGAELNVRIS
jgi:hypothetical protein